MSTAGSAWRGSAGSGSPGSTLSGPTIVTEDVYAMTRMGPAVRPVGWEGLEPGARTYRGARFEHAAAPCLPIVGTVRDVETGRPIAGVKVRGEVEPVEGRANHPGGSTTTDDQGRYVLTGLPREAISGCRASSTRGLAYVGRSDSMVVGSATGKPVRYDIGLRKGVVIRGRVTNQATGKPMRAGVTYFPFPDDPRLKGYPKSEQYNACRRRRQVRDRRPAGPRGDRRTTGDGRYLQAAGADRIEGLDRIPALRGGRSTPCPIPGDRRGEPAAGTGPAIRDLQLVPARTVKGTVVDPDGKPIVEAVAMGLEANVPWAGRVLASGDFAVEDVDPASPAASPSSTSAAGSPGRCGSRETRPARCPSGSSPGAPSPAGSSTTEGSPNPDWC